jgi:quinoprotein glucose dehydrogenase
MCEPRAREVRRPRAFGAGRGRRLAVGVMLCSLGVTADGQTPPNAGEWRQHHRDYAGTHFAPFAQISSRNVGQLREAWRWTPDTAQKPPELRNISTPLMVDGVLYFTSGAQRAVIAVEARSGVQRWRWSIEEPSRRASSPRRNSGRGVAYWEAGRDRRIFVVTPGFQLVALDAGSGRPVPSFGRDGVVDLKAQLGVPVHPDSGAIGSSSPPLVWGNIVVVGPALEVGLQPRSRRNVPGRVLAFDARSGALKWRFHTIPQAGEFGNNSWKDSSWTYTGNTGVWAPMSLDERRGRLYLPVEAATGDYYGGHRPGDNLFSTSLVCLNIRTGKRIWHQQIVRHDIWDYDNPTAPILADVTVNGRRREIVAQITKQAFVYVFDRVTGDPVWPFEERAVPASDVPGEVAASTQRFPTRPRPFDRQGVTVDDLIDFTPALRAKALEVVKPYRLGSLFTPPSLAAAPDGTKGTLSLPGTVGGGNWEHGSFDPESGVLYVGSFTDPAVLALAHVPTRSDMNYVFVGGDAGNVDGLPLIKPPYSRITAIDLARGEHLWTVPSGDTPEHVKNHPALAGLTIPPTGGFTRPVLVATRTLLFTGEGSGGGTGLRALDKRTGATLWQMTLPGAVTAQPMSYMLEGKQYLVFWIGASRSRPFTTLMAFTL